MRPPAARRRRRWGRPIALGPRVPLRGGAKERRRGRASSSTLATSGAPRLAPACRRARGAAVWVDVTDEAKRLARACGRAAAAGCGAPRAAAGVRDGRRAPPPPDAAARRRRARRRRRRGRPSARPRPKSPSSPNGGTLRSPLAKGAAAARRHRRAGPRARRRRGRWPPRQILWTCLRASPSSARRPRRSAVEPAVRRAALDVSTAGWHATPVDALAGPPRPPFRHDGRTAARGSAAAWRRRIAPSGGGDESLVGRAVDVLATSPIDTSAWYPALVRAYTLSDGKLGLRGRRRRGRALSSGCAHVPRRPSCSARELRDRDARSPHAPLSLAGTTAGSCCRARVPRRSSAAPPRTPVSRTATRRRGFLSASPPAATGRLRSGAHLRGLPGARHGARSAAAVRSVRARRATRPSASACPPSTSRRRRAARGVRYCATCDVCARPRRLRDRGALGSRRRATCRTAGRRCRRAGSAALRGVSRRRALRRMRRQDPRAMGRPAPARSAARARCGARRPPTPARRQGQADAAAAARERRRRLPKPKKVDRCGRCDGELAIPRATPPPR